MPDSEITGLVATTAGQLQSLISTLQLVVDAPTFTDAQKLALATLLYSSAVTANTNNYQAMTPKAFYDSVMNTTTRGIERAATDAEVTTKAGTGVLNAEDQTLMQSQWMVDWFRKEGIPNVYHYAGYAMAWQMVDYIDSMSVGNSVPLSPVLPAERTFDGALVTLLVGSILGEAYGIFKIPAQAGVKTSVPVFIGGSVRFYLTIDATRKFVSIEAAAAATYIRVSATIQATLK